ncbi:zinc transport system substrate-binding protein [Cricetibacter osteomyelitidis]|uniref:High-affinity zinc uptake system protein ZnuA n=2 Tax=Cricetibacter osteomyelitidis TaxID=1521931 RepID=A0A4R2TRN9_9PAST|nr:zinc ABC transporter substrate-binding protein ZnuA [Cricetibacter osteomyelitidis]TCP97702.1 zinc transport system substrate-binding protein [Cricetibacter osteomyelitidis]
MSLFSKTAIASAVLSVSFAANANVLTTIKPLGFIASSIADGVTETEVLLPASASPHDYSLKPSDVQKVKEAQLVLWIGEDVDAFLEKTVDGLDEKNVLTIADIKGVEPLLSEGSEHHHHHDHDHDGHGKHADHDHEKHEAHEHHHDHEGHHHGEHELNWHVWFSPKVSELVAEQLAEKLIAQYPDKKALIAQNLADFKTNLTEQSAKITQQLVPVKGKGFYVFHDAYGYFNETYGLQQTGSFTINPLVAPGARTLAKIKSEIEQHKVSCLFAEPQFTPKVIESLQKSTGVHVGTLDPLGEKVALGKNSYGAFLQNIADSYIQCLVQ